MTIETEPAAAGAMMIPCPLTCANIGSRGESGRRLRSAPRGKAPLRLSCWATAVLAVVMLAPIGTASAQEGLRFQGVGSAAQEVQDPPVESEGLADGRFTFADDLSELDARVDVEGLTSAVVATHLHCAIAGVNGEIIVDLLPTGPDGRIVDDTFDNEDVDLEVDCTPACGFAINNIASLRAAAEDGCLYLNVHTEEFPAGEVRGQLLVR
jgi:CHRD domain